MARSLFAALALLLPFFACRADGSEAFKETTSSVVVVVAPVKSRPAFERRARQLAVRGGGGAGGLPSVPTLSREFAADVFTVAYLLQGPVCLFFPRLNAAAYGVKDSDVAEFLMTTSGGSIAGLGIASYCLRKKGTSPRAAIGAAAAPMLIPLVRALAGGRRRREKIGPRRGPLLAGTSFAALAAGAAFVDRPWAAGYLRLRAAVGILNGALGAIFPATTASVWGLRLDADRVGDRVMTRCHSTWQLGAHLTAFGALAGVDPARALGFGSVPAFALLLAGNFVTGEFRELGMSRGPQIFWFLFNLVFLSATIL